MNKIILSAASLLVGFSLMAADSDIVSVKGKGVGVDETAALKDAYRDAVETAVGLYVDAEQMIKNDSIIKDEILTHSNAYVEGYEVLETATEGGLTKVKILAQVKKRLLAKKIEGVMPAQVVAVGDALKNFHSRSETQVSRNESGAAILSKTLKGLDLMSVVLDYNLVCPTPHIIGEEDNVVSMGYLFKASINQERYFNTVVPGLKQVLDQISTISPKEVTIAMTRGADIDLEECMSGWLSFHEQPCSCGGLKVEVTSSEVGCRWHSRNDLIHQGCAWQTRRQLSVLLVVKANKVGTVFSGLIYVLDEDALKELDRWYVSSANRREPRFRASFLDEDGEPLSVKSGIVARNRWEVDCTGVGADGTFVIAPWCVVPGVCQGYFRQDFKLEKRILPMIKSIKVELLN